MIKITTAKFVGILSLFCGGTTVGVLVKHNTLAEAFAFENHAPIVCHECDKPPRYHEPPPYYPPEEPPHATVPAPGTFLLIGAGLILLARRR